jgi:hypothetical protein
MDYLSSSYICSVLREENHFKRTKMGSPKQDGIHLAKPILLNGKSQVQSYSVTTFTLGMSCIKIRDLLGIPQTCLAFNSSP